MPKTQTENLKVLKKFKNTLEINTSDGKYIIKAYSDKIVETSFIPKGETYNPMSEAVVLSPKPGISKIIKTPSTVSLYTKGNCSNHSKITFSNLVFQPTKTLVI